MAKRVMIFDFDGVVGDTYGLNWDLVRSLHPGVAERSYRIDHHLGNVFEAPVVPFTPGSSEEYYRRYNEQLAVDHVHTALPALIRLADDFDFHIVTSNCEVAIQRVLGEAEVLHLFGLILGREAHESKVQKFQHLARAKNFSLQNAIFVTDTLGDLNEAAKVSLPAIAVTFGYHPKELLLQGVCRATADSWDELAELSRTL